MRKECLYRAYAANIHEERAAAVVCRSVPWCLLSLTLVASVVGILWKPLVILTLSAALNTALWIYLVLAGTFTIIGARRAQRALRAADASLGAPGRVDGSEACPEASATGDIEKSAPIVSHLVVYPNYKEDEDMMAQTLESLSEAEGSEHFRVVLAMEAREGEEGKAKGARLVERFGSAFKWITATYHPAGLKQRHLDGSEDLEVPGKASNLRWAVAEAHKKCRAEPSCDLDMFIVTVADADCLFHPKYFQALGEDYLGPELQQRRRDGGKHVYTMWQAPQLPFRSLWHTPAPSRTWGYLASMDEFGGVTSLSDGGRQMVFSGYSLTLRLAVEAQPWDGDVIAEDHHSFLKCFFYSIYKATEAGTAGDACLLQVRPIYLPVKSTSVISPEGFWQTCVERWHQAKRHMQGVAEVSYALLAAWDLLTTMPRRNFTFPLLFSVLRTVCRPFTIHLLPTLQALPFGILSVWWYLHHRMVPGCPDRVSLVDSRGEMVLCGLAGAWALVWPVVVPVMFLVVSNYLLTMVVFVSPRAERAAAGLKATVWHTEDGDVRPRLGSKRLAVLLGLFVDCPLILVFSPVYGFLPEVLAYWSTMVNGNRIKYVTAAKLANANGNVKSYGALPAPGK